MPAAYYLVVEDNSISKGVLGRVKEFYYVPETGKPGTYKDTEIGGYAKPVLYLYPEEKTE